LATGARNLKLQRKMMRIREQLRGPPVEDKLSIELRKRLHEEIPETSELKRRYASVGAIVLACLTLLVISDQYSRNQSKADVQTENLIN